MTKRCELAITLISSGIIEPRLHYGLFLRNWWFIPTTKSSNDIEMMYPIWVSMKTQVEINEKKFIMHVLEGNRFDINQPGYTCQCGSDSSEIEDNPINAITSLYRQIFKTQTKILGSIVMGFDKESIFSELLHNIEFRPYSISLADKLSIMVFSLGVSKKKGWMGSGEGYMASFIHVFRKEQKYRGTQLFGFEHTYTQSVLQQSHIPKCQPSQWNNEELMNRLYEYHLKKRTIVEINWLQLFKQWKFSGYIIEINTTLSNLYSKKYQFNDREMQAWSSMLKATGCTNVTPFNSNISPYKFWTRSLDPMNDKKTLKDLFQLGFLNPYPSSIQNPSQIFWNCFARSLAQNQNITRQTWDNVSSTTINAAKKYATLNGPGCRQINKPIIIRNPPFTKEIENQFEAFFLDKANVSMSSYKKRFSEIYPNGIKRTAFMARIEDGPYKYRENLGGLCSICAEYGYEVFDDLAKIIRLHIENLPVQNKLLQDVELIKRHMKREYVCEINVGNNGHIEHNECIDHCLLYAFESILSTEEKQLLNDKKEKLFHYYAHQTRKVFLNAQVQANLLELDNVELIKRHMKREYVCEINVGNNGHIEHNECIDHYLLYAFESILSTEEKQLLNDKKEKLFHYYAHQTRKVFLNAQVQANLLELDSDGAVLIVDYKMRILPKLARESNWTLHFILMYTKSENDEKLAVAAFDHWSADTRQDAWFTASSLHAVFDVMFKKPKWITLILDNGPHYHNSEMMLILAHWKDWYDIEAGEAKTAIDSHHAQIAHAIKRYVRVEFEIKEGIDIENAIKDLYGTSIGELNPNREKNDKKIKSLVGIFNMNEWKWPIDGPFAGSILARSLPNIGDFTNYSFTQIQKLSKSEIIKPSLTFTTPSVPKYLWTIPMPNLSNTNSKRIRIHTPNENLEQISNRIIDEKSNITVDAEFQLAPRWVLKANQKFGRRGGTKMSKKIITLLQGFFHAGNADKSDRYSANDMLSELTHMANNGELDSEIIPKVETIKNWIS
ncbi:hypothetical protein Glove_253g31 [Diversispora epigaea]|uniref:Uncharacterized protein n=1 Tax=Diversispora epigaea TaxID=1348612 RepID=A0A397IFB2_9GLOM|nr:hypothetical protein Glove_253g31 [Diversispora epigaea]